MVKHLKSNLIAFFESRAGRVLLVISALLLSYVFASWAINSGSLLDWGIALILLIIAGRESAYLIKQPRTKNVK